MTRRGDIALRVRQNAGSAALAAACLMFFGFLGGFQPPEVTNLFTLGDAVFNYTLRIGGVLMAVVAAASLTGRLFALAADASVSAGIGLLLVLSGICMLAGGGGLAVNYVLYVVFGGLFLSVGVRNGREYLAMTTAAPKTPAHS